MTASPDRRYLIVSNNGWSTPSLTVVDTQRWAIKAKVPVEHAWLGLAWDAAGKRLYSAGAAENTVRVFDYAAGALKQGTPLVVAPPALRLPPGTTDMAGTGFIGGLAMSGDGKTLYAVHVFGRAISAIDLATGAVRVTATLPAEPYTVVPAADGRRVFVSLWGGARVLALDATTLAVTGEVEVGGHPNAMALSKDGQRLFVACANTNKVWVLDTAGLIAREQIGVSPFPEAPPGTTPNALAVSPDGDTLAVANADNNTVAMIDIEQPGRSEVEGFIPTGWYPTAVLFDETGRRLFVLSGKGLIGQANPRGPAAISPTAEGQYAGQMLQGTVSVIDVPDATRLAAHTARVVELSAYTDAKKLTPAGAPAASPIPRRVGDPSPIKHVFYVIRENRTYDQVLGDLEQGNGDPTLAIFGEDVTPNAHALARQFVLFDNFYVDAEVSYDGHAFSTGAYATDVVEKLWPTNYGRRGGVYLSEGGYGDRNPYGNLSAPSDGYIWDGMPRPLSLTVLTAALAMLVGPAPHAAPPAPAAWAGAPGARVLLDAHNCYPDGGQWADRIDRALATGLPVAIEQDLVWFRDPRSGVSRSILSHGEPFTGTEPSLATHFFERIRPVVEQALRDGRRETWPLVVLNLDLKTNEPEHHAAIWETLGTYADWLTTAERVADGSRPAPLDVKPVLVLTGNPDAQQAAFHDRVPVGGRLRVFGAIPVDVEAKVGKGREAIPKLAGLSPAELIASGATNYRRWVNFPWAVVERGGQAEAGAWTPADAARLAALSALAHSRGLWIRFYTLNGHAEADDRGWTASYNFGSPAAVETRWRAARDAGVDFIASDQYEGLARILARPAAQSATPPATSPRPRRRRSARACRDAASRCCPTAGASPGGPAPAGRRLPAVDDGEPGPAIPDHQQQRLVDAVADRRGHPAVGDQGQGAGRARVARPGVGRRRQAALLGRRGREHRPRLRLRRRRLEAGHAAGGGAAGAAAAAGHDRHGRDRLRRRHRHRGGRQDAVRGARLRPRDQRDRSGDRRGAHHRDPAGRAVHRACRLRTDAASSCRCGAAPGCSRSTRRRWRSPARSRSAGTRTRWRCRRTASACSSPAPTRTRCG